MDQVKVSQKAKKTSTPHWTGFQVLSLACQRMEQEDSNLDSLRFLQAYQG
jgi:hypothetical protein